MTATHQLVLSPRGRLLLERGDGVASAFAADDELTGAFAEGSARGLLALAVRRREAGAWPAEWMDEKPELFFTLRGVEMEELLTAASASATAPIAGAAVPGQGLEDAALSEIFGVEIEAAAPAQVLPADRGKPARKPLPAKRAKAATKARRKAKSPKKK